MSTRKRAPWLAAAALCLSLGPAAASAQDPTQGRTGNDPFDAPGTPDTPLDELGEETQRQLEEQRRRQAEDQEEAMQQGRDDLLDPEDLDLDVDVTPGP